MREQADLTYPMLEPAQPARLPKETITWPLVMAGASLMSVVGGLLGLALVPINRTNPFYYTSIINPAIYCGINAYRCWEVTQRNKSYAETEMEKIEVVIGR